MSARLPSRWAALDFETADSFSTRDDGTRVCPSHACEIGVVVVVDGRIVDRYETRICPAVPISDAARLVHGLSPSDVADAPLFAAAWATVAALLQSHGVAALVAHNAPFDAGVLESEIARAGLDPLTLPWFDSVSIARWAWPSLARGAGGQGHGLRALGEALGFADAHRHHSAGGDALACALVTLAACEVRRQGATGPDAVRVGQAFVRGALARGPL